MILKKLRISRIEKDKSRNQQACLSDKNNDLIIPVL